MSSTKTIKNPIIPGFYPDPSICRVGDDFYLVCSSFELFPGIPIFHSRNLADWKQIGYVMDERNHFHVTANTFNGGVMAPTIRYHQGTFYVINMNYSDRGNFIVTAKDPAGPWSEPYWLPDVDGLDASLFFDDDGKVYIIGLGKVVERPDGTLDDGIWLREFSLDEMKPVGETSVIWDSALRVAKFPESPHIYKVNGYYHLVIAEGGTEFYHSVVTARSKELRGWYEGNPGNPVISHRQLGRDYPIHNIGHADLVDTPNGKWYAVLLGSRCVGGCHYNMGRETFLCPVIWEENWPVFSPGTGKMEWEYIADADLTQNQTSLNLKKTRDNFDSAHLSMEWNFWGTPYTDYQSIHNSSLVLKCLPRGISDSVHCLLSLTPEYQKKNGISFIGRRQLNMSFNAMCEMEFTPKNQETAGIVLLQAMNHQYKMEKVCVNGIQQVQVVLVTTNTNGPAHLPAFRGNTTETVLARAVCDDEKIVFKVSAKKQYYSFYFGKDENHLTLLCQDVDSRLINPPEIGTYTGTMLGMYASGNGKDSENAASFDWFEYEGLE